MTDRSETMIDFGGLCFSEAARDCLTMPTGKRSDACAVLVVDDEPLLRMVLVDLFEDAGYKVREAAHAAEALALLEASPDIGIVVTDIQMPGSMDGLRLAAYIRDAYPPIALIISSGAVEPTKAALPADAIFMRKPVDHEELLATVNELADHAR